MDGRVIWTDALKSVDGRFPEFFEHLRRDEPAWIGGPLGRSADSSRSRPDNSGEVKGSGSMQDSDSVCSSDVGLYSVDLYSRSTQVRSFYRDVIPRRNDFSFVGVDTGKEGIQEKVMLFLTQSLTIKVAALVALTSAIYGNLFSLIEGLGFTGSFLSAILGALTILLPAYLLHRRESLKRLDDARKLREQGLSETTDSVLRYSTERERRLDEISQNLRLEERTMYLKQMEISRRRGHILARGMMSLELANERLMALLAESHIQVPFEMTGIRLRSSIIQELKDLENEQELIIPLE